MYYPMNCRIRDGWANAGRVGVLHGVVKVNHMRWGVVSWDDKVAEKPDPELHKACGLDVANTEWVEFRTLCPAGLGK